MTQLLQNIYTVAPYLFMLVLMGVAATGVWLVLQLRKSAREDNFSISDELFLKRNASRMRKIQLH